MAGVLGWNVVGGMRWAGGYSPLFGGWGCYALGIYLKPVLKLFLEDGGLIYTKVLEVI